MHAAEARRTASLLMVVVSIAALLGVPAPPRTASVVPVDLPPDVAAAPLTFQTLPAADAEAGAGPVDSAVEAAGARAAWRTTRGASSVVALVDSGVADIPALRGAIAGEVDFTGTAGGDGFGHGTAMASLIAGRGPVAPGVAPEAGVLSLKVAGDDGATDVGTVLAALDWLAGPGRALGVEVAVLALGTEPDSEAGEVLDVAVDRLAHLGVLVVTAAGNTGPGQLLSPATAPTSLSVGATDDGGTADHADDTTAAFSADGVDRVGVGQPDVSASGVRVVTAVDPASRLAIDNPQAVVGDGLLRGSGTSVAAALVGGVAALVADAHPGLDGSGLATALRAQHALDAPAALAAAAALPHAPTTMADPDAARAYADALTEIRGDRDAALARIDERAEVTRRRVEGRATGRALTQRLEALERRAQRQRGRVQRQAERRLERAQRRLQRADVARPSTAGWTAAAWQGEAWHAGPWAAARFEAHDFGRHLDATDPADVLALDVVLTTTAGIPLVVWEEALWQPSDWATGVWQGAHWHPAQWSVVHWGTVAWGGVDWSRLDGPDSDWSVVHWGVVHWGVVHWGAADWSVVHWGSAGWSVVHWGVVHWGGVDWSVVHWGVVHWGLAPSWLRA